uniref:protein kinase domain-containing protein n=1 Tax=uncultured Gimesia sp. TaxID=1678688 RepID=UPI002619C8F0
GSKMNDEDLRPISNDDEDNQNDSRSEQRGADTHVPGIPAPELTRSLYPDGEALGDQIGPYRLLETLGEGGMGTVFLAEQREPVHRRVASKIIKSGMDTSQVIARFEAERQALAMMDHANIAKVLDAGTTATGRPFFVMELVKGTPITKFCDDHKLGIRARLELFSQVCSAVQHAHQKGIIHRDLKPNNILVTQQDDQPIPKVIDFGLVKATNQRLTEKTLFTTHGQVLGTLEYMSPEQAQLNEVDIDTRSDIYSLGVILYELLAGSTPLRRETLREAGYMEILKRIKEEEPERPSSRISVSIDTLESISSVRQVEPRKLSAMVKGDLDWIVLKAMEKNRSRRYETANGLASDIRRYLTDEPIEARPPSAGYRLQKLVRKNRVAFAFAATVALLLLVGICVSSYLALWATSEAHAARLASQRADDERDKAKHAQVEAEKLEQAARKSQKKTRQILYAAHMNSAFRASADGNTKSLVDLLEQHRPQVGQEDMRGFEWYYLFKKYHDSHQIFHSAGVIDLTVPEKSTEVWINDGLIGRYDFEKKRKTWMYRGPGPVRNFTLSSDKSRLAACLETGSILIWDIADNRQVSMWQETSNLNDFAFSEDGQHLVIGLENGLAKVHDTTTGKMIYQLSGHSGPVWSVACSPDGNWIATGSGTAPVPSGTVFLWDALTGQVKSKLTSHTHLISALQFSPDGRVLAVGTGIHDSGVHLWNVEAGNKIRVLSGHQGGINAICFSPDGALIATGGVNGIVQIWDFDNVDAPRVIQGHEIPISAIAFTNDQKWLISSDRVHGAKLWNLEEQTKESEFVSYSSSLNAVDFSGDGKLIGMVGWHGMTIADVSTGKTILQSESGNKPGHEAHLLKFTPENDVVVAGGGTNPAMGKTSGPDKSGKATLWNIKNALATPIYSDLQFFIQSLDISPDGRFIAVKIANEPGIRIWDCRSKKHKTTLKVHSDEVNGLKFLSDNQTLLAVSPAGILYFDTNSWSLRKQRRDQRRLWGNSLSLSPDGQFLAINGFGGSTSILDTRRSEIIADFRGHTTGFKASFSPDGNTLATAGMDGRIVLRHVPSWQEMGIIENGFENFRALAFSPDGSWLVTGGGGTFGGRKHFLFEASPIQEEWEVSGHRHLIHELALSPDGGVVASASHDGTVKIWNSREWSEIASLSGHKGVVTGVAFSPDGHLLASIHYDWETKSDPKGGLTLWDTKTWKPVWIRQNDAMLTTVSFTPDSRSIM